MTANAQQRIDGRSASVETWTPAGSDVRFIRIAASRIDDDDATLIAGAVREGLADAGVSVIALAINSHGSRGEGVIQTARMIFNSRHRKLFASCVERKATSGAFILSLACGHVRASVGATLGCLGVVRYDESDRPVAWTPGKRTGRSNGSVLDEAEVTVKHYDDCDLMAQFRGLPRREIQTLADGRAFNGREAMTMGLVDSTAPLGSWLRSLMPRASYDTISRCAARVCGRASW